MKIIYQGQIGIVVGLTSEERDVSGETTVADLISEIAKDKSAEVARFLVNEDGQISSSLFAALDDTHVLDYSIASGRRVNFYSCRRWQVDKNHQLARLDALRPR